MKRFGLRLPPFIVVALAGVGCSDQRVTPGEPSFSFTADQGANGVMEGPLGNTLTATPVPMAEQFRIKVAGDYVAAGFGMRNTGSGTISISLPSGAAIQKAFLYWSVMEDPAAPAAMALAAGNLNGTAITGSLVGATENPCWVPSAGKIHNFRADVTSLAVDGTNTLSDFASGRTDGSDPFPFSNQTPPLLEGASLVVIFSHSGAGPKEVIIHEGAVTTIGPPPTTTTFSSFTAGGSPVQARTTFIVADGQHPPDQPGLNNRIYVDGTEIGNHTLNGAGPGTQLWDTETRDISSFVPSGDDSVTVGIESFTDGGFTDCITWVAQVLSVSGTLVPANQAATVTVQENGKAVAGIAIPANTFNEDVNVTVRFVDLDQLQAGVQCHDFLLAQIDRCLEIRADRAIDGEPADLLNDVIVGLCVREDEALAHPELEIFKFEDPEGTDRPVALKETSADFFLDCSGFVGSASPSGLLDQFASAVKRLGQWLGPKPLIAAVDRGFGGIIPDDGILSFFTWAEPIQISFASLVVNRRNRGKDAFAVSGRFDLGTQGFNPLTHAVIVGYGKFVQTIPAGSFRPASGRFVYKAPPGNTTGILYMELFTDGRFLVNGVVPTEGFGLDPVTFRAFGIQVHERAQGGGLECTAQGECRLHH